MSQFEKFNVSNQENSEPAKSVTEKELLQFDPSLEGDSKFKEIIGKVHDLDEIYNNVDLTKKKLIFSKFVEKCGWIITALGVAELAYFDGVNYLLRGGGFHAALDNAEVGEWTIIVGLLIKLISKKVTERNTDRNKKAMDKRIAYHINTDTGLDTQ